MIDSRVFLLVGGVITSGALLLLPACATAPKPLELTYPNEESAYFGLGPLKDSARRVSQYFVKVFVYSGIDPTQLVSVGSGTLIDEVGHFVTAAHVVKSDEHRVYIKDMKGSLLPAEIVHINQGSEIALLRISIRYGLRSGPEVNEIIESGQKAFAIGVDSSNNPVVSVGITRGILAGRRFRSGPYGFGDPVELVMNVDTGYSGGPVFDERGRLIGMIVGFNSDNDGQGVSDRMLRAYAISASRIYDYYYQWRQ